MGCSPISGSGKECSANSDERNWNTCYQSTGICAYEEMAGLTGAGIAGVVMGVFAFVLILIAITVVCVRKGSTNGYNEVAAENE